jgi:tRNA nucleotidyltransferase (CCA-adding enzyme)
MTSAAPSPEPERLGERLAALPGIERLREAVADVSAYLVGGGVRDLLLGRDRADIDVAVEGDVGAVGQRLGGEVRTHERFATATARLDDLEIDLATARAETYPSPGALPEVRPATIEDDLARRDFTVNAMAVPLKGDPDLTDPHGGLADLERGELRVLHDRSFVDDPTRALRAARYAARYGFKLEPETEALLRSADLSTVSEDRVERELLKLAAEPEAGRGFELLDDWGLIPLEPRASRLIAAVGALLEREPWRGLVERPLAIHAAATGHAPGPAGRLRDLRAAAEELAAKDPTRPSEIVELARQHGDIELALARALGAEWLDRYVSEWRLVDLEIDGDDLLEAGIPEGPAIGRGLAAALRAKLDGEVSGREDELRVALEVAREKDIRPGT